MLKARADAMSGAKPSGAPCVAQRGGAEPEAERRKSGQDFIYSARTPGPCVHEQSGGTPEVDQYPKGQPTLLSIVAAGATAPTAP